MLGRERITQPKLRNFPTPVVRQNPEEESATRFYGIALPATWWTAPPLLVRSFPCSKPSRGFEPQGIRSSNVQRDRDLFAIGVQFSDSIPKLKVGYT